MSDARHKGKKHCRSLRAEHKLYELGMASKSQIIAKATGTTLTLLLFYNLCHTGNGRGLDCCAVPVLQHSHLLVNTKHIFANLQMKTCPNGKDNYGLLRKPAEILIHYNLPFIEPQNSQFLYLTCGALF